MSGNINKVTFRKQFSKQVLLTTCQIKNEINILFKKNNVGIYIQCCFRFNF